VRPNQAQEISMRWLFIPFLVASLCVPAIVTGEESPGEITWQMSQAERTAIKKLSDDMVLYGFPRIAGGELWAGEMGYEITYRTGDSSSSIGSNKDGLHVKLPDGSWLIDLRYHLKPSENLSLDATKLTAIAVPDLIGYAQKQQQSEGDKDDYYAWVEQEIVPEDQARAKRGFAAGALVELLRKNSSDLTVPILVLAQLGSNDVESLACYCTVQALSNQVGLDYFAGKAIPIKFSPMSNERHYLPFEGSWSAEEKAEAKKQSLPATDTVLRQGLAGYYLARLAGGKENNDQLHAAQTFPSPEECGKIIAQILQPLPATWNVMKPHVERMCQQAAIPALTPDEPALERALMVWRDNKIPDLEPDDTLRTVRVSFRTPEHWEYERLYEKLIYLQLSETTPAQVMRLIGDERPSRWIDQYRVRSVGDNAIRYFSNYIGCDPRLLIGRDQQTLWTSEERAATVQALQTWWTNNKDKSLVEQISPVIDKIERDQLVNLLARCAPAQRGQLLDTMIAQFEKKSETWSPQMFAQLLRGAGKHVGLSAYVDKQRDQLHLRFIIAAWKQDNGDGSMIDSLLSEMAHIKKGRVKSNSHVYIPEIKEEFYWTAMIKLLAHYATPQRIQSYMTGVTALPAVQRSYVLEALLSMYWNGYDGLNNYWGEDRFTIEERPDGDVIRAKRTAGLLIIYALEMQNNNPATQKQVKNYANHTEYEDGKPKKKAPPAKDLRMADIAVDQFLDVAPRFGLESVLGKRENRDIRDLKIDLSGEKKNRDIVIQRVRAIIAKALPKFLSSAQLPTTIPTLTDMEPATTSAADDPVF
jgi:hypothetical protein